MSVRILLAADGSSIARNAVRFAIERFGLPNDRCSVDLFHSHFALPPRAASALGREIVNAYYREETAKALAEAEKLLASRGVPYRTIAKVGPAAARIVAYAERADTDLIVMGSHGRGGAKGLLLGSVAQGVLAGCSIPVVLVREARSQSPDGPVLVAIDGSGFAARALAWVLRQRDLLVGERELVLMSVVPGEGRLPGVLGKKRTQAVQDAEFEQAMTPARRQLERSGVRWREICAHGEAGMEIAAHAQRIGAGLIVMGSHGRGGMTSLLLGSVTQRTLSECTVPLLVVR